MILGISRRVVMEKREAFPTVTGRFSGWRNIMPENNTRVLIKFEMGIIDPRNQAFDHHGAIAHGDAFVAKMAAVQMLEWLMMTGQDPQELEIQVNHCGHMDDIVAHAVAPAAEAGKIRSLYRFAVVVSVVDSCGPSGYMLLQRDDKALVDASYGRYHEVLGEIADKLGVPKWQVPLEKQIEASKAAAAVLVAGLEVDDYEPAIPTAPAKGSYEVVARDEGVFLVRITDANGCNGIRHSAFFYAEGACAVVAYFDRGENRHEYSACVRSNYDGDLSGVWPQLAAQEEVPDGCRNWGGHSGAGGSPFPNEKAGFPGGSTQSPEDVYELVKSALRG